MSGAREVRDENTARAFRVLGIFWVVYGVARLVEALWLVFFGNTATLMFGALLNRVADPFTLMNFFHLFYIALVILSAVCGIAGIVAGAALIGRSYSAKSIAIAAAFLSVSSVPFGTTLGVYTLVMLLGTPRGSPAVQTVEPRMHAIKHQTSASAGY